MPALSSIVAVGISIPVSIAFNVWYGEWRWKREAERMGARLPPRVRGRRLGNLDILRGVMDSFKSGYLADITVEMQEQLGTIFDMHILWANVYFTTSPDHMQAMLATQFSNFEKGAWFQKSMHSFLGVGVFNADGDMWKFHRSMARPFFSRDRITHFELFDRYANTVIAQMKSRFREGYALDFQEIIARFTMDAATDFLFGSCLNSLEDALPYPHFVSGRPQSPTSQFADAFLKGQDVITERQRKGWSWPLYEMTKDATAEHAKVVRDYVDPIIKAALGRKRSVVDGISSQNTTFADTEKGSIDDDESLLDHLLKQTSDPTLVRDETINILLAGRDTTAATLTFAVYFLSMYPDVMTRLREEVLMVVGSVRMPTFDDIREMKFLRAVLNETLRLFPVVPFNIRESISATTLPSEIPGEKPIYIPARTPVMYSVWIMHRRKDLWGPDAEEFDPDRFLDDRAKKYLHPRPFIFLPFNAGPRICLGQQFAYNEASFMLVRLLQNFSSFVLDEKAQPPSSRPPAEWRNDPRFGEATGVGKRTRQGMDKVWPKATLTAYSAGGLWIKGVVADQAAV
ncbi:cytochrome P450 monooxygenase pc-2 [Cylindrobasidium torrendii FP15055 ss-10]|uniref:Cytochrome P450 monooxygenase pc-2 n=1 Tax=Cylindrobasidium torrendii FP15055 ss-10 TaxID=1314674 RepID=A0A0D7B0I0_9AGAR|nr:cytochrome P450 monooxygenase pc-2 [Cylindrobasidium torrendii FP15055 ss-10]